MKNTPRDFFLHLTAFITLYLSAIALITLLFRLIDYSFPDAARAVYYYSDPYSGPMRFAIASLIILVPFTLWLIRLLQVETRKNPERQSLGIRRWLTYITLFIAGLTIIGDLIALLNSFLGGTLGTPFLLKVVVLLGIMGATFWYFILDIRGYWQKEETSSKLVGIGVAVTVIASIAVGFMLMGSPSVQRELRFDANAIQALQNIQYQIVDYWQRNEELPASLSILASDVTGFQLPESAAGRAPYTYKRTGALSFEICAEFARASDERYQAISAPEAYGLKGSSWKHDAGNACFTRTIDPNLVKPYTSIIR